MHITNLRRVGGSVMLAVPRVLLDVLHLQAGASVGINVEDGHLVVKPQTIRYTLDELLAQCDPSVEMDAQEREWLESATAGKELL